MSWYDEPLTWEEREALAQEAEDRADARADEWREDR